MALRGALQDLALRKRHFPCKSHPKSLQTWPAVVTARFAWADWKLPCGGWFAHPVVVSGFQQRAIGPSGGQGSGWRRVVGNRDQGQLARMSCSAPAVSEPRLRWWTSPTPMPFSYGSRHSKSGGHPSALAQCQMIVCYRQPTGLVPARLPLGKPGSGSSVATSRCRLRSGLMVGPSDRGATRGTGRAGRPVGQVAGEGACRARRTRHR